MTVIVISSLLNCGILFFLLKATFIATSGDEYFGDSICIVSARPIDKAKCIRVDADPSSFFFGETLWSHVRIYFDISAKAVKDGLIVTV